MDHHSGNQKISKQDKLNDGTEEEITIEGYRYSQKKSVLYGIINTLTFGFVFIVQYSFNRAAPTKFTHSKCSTRTAQKVCIKDRFGSEFIRNVVGTVDDAPKESFTRISLCETELRAETKELTEIDPKPSPCQRYFKFKKIKYLWNPTSNKFERLNYSLPSGNSWKGRNESEIEQLMELYGINSITIAIDPIYKLILDTITTPLYLYQIFITSVWMIQSYYSFATCVIFMSVISISLYVYETRKVSNDFPSSL